MAHIDAAVRTSNFVSNTNSPPSQSTMTRSSSKFEATHELNTRLHFYIRKQKKRFLSCKFCHLHIGVTFRYKFECSYRYILAVCRILKVVQSCPYHHVDTVQLVTRIITAVPKAFNAVFILEHKLGKFVS